jgi:glycosyltransferase involved in cell wall biosynthesis
MKYLMVSSYAPMKCGIGAYALQMVKKIQNQGNSVKILSPPEGGGDFRANLKGGFNLLKLIRFGFSFDKIIIQYHESFYYDEKTVKNLFSLFATHISFILIFFIFRSRIELILHEFPRSYPLKLDYFCEKLKWLLCPKIVFHTKKEVADFEALFFKIPSSHIEIRSPSAYFFKFRNISQKEARIELKIPLTDVMFLCIGFIQPHKGFDRAALVFGNIKNTKMHLYIVGDLRLQWENYQQYFTRLKNIAENCANVHLVVKYPTDEEFDTWISASDVVITPYREIWSSSVVGRAKIFNKPVIASNIGALSEQISQKDLLFNTDEELEMIIQDFANYCE